MKLRKWIAGATCACMLLTVSPPVAVMAETLPQAATNAAARATIGDFNVTGGNLGTDYSFENDTLTIKSSRHLTIKTNATTAHRIKVAPNVQANITLAGVHIEVPNGVEAPAMDLHEASASTINLAKDTTNTLDASRTGDLGAGLRTTKKGFVTINGPGALIAKGGQKWPGIGGFAGKMEAGDQYPGEANIRITGGTIEASTATKELAAAIGGSQKQGYPNIQITGGKVTAYGDIGPSPTVPTQAEFGKLTISNAVVQVVSDTITKSQRDFNDCIVGRNLEEYNVYGNWTISEDVTIPQGIWLNVESGGRLNIGAKAALTNKGGVHVWGNATINADGALVRAGKGQYQVESGGKILNNKPPVPANGYTIVGNTVQAKPGYEISFNQSSWSNSEEFKTNTTYYIRKKGDAPTFGPSGPNSFSFSESNRLPAPTVTLDYVNETLSTDESMEYDTRFIDAPWPTCPKNMPLSKLNDMHGWKNGQSEGGVDIRNKARDGFLASEAVYVTLPKRPAAPTVGFSYKNGTIETKNTMEYRMSDNEGWTSCNGELTILDEWFGKTMQIRTKAVQGQKFASFAQKLQIPSHEVLKLTIDTAKEGVTVPSGHRYKVSGAKDWTTSTGELVTVAPGETIEIVKPSTDTSFQSEVLRLTAPTRGAQPSVAFHYANETVTTTAAMQYRVDGGKWTDCTVNMKIAEAWFGKNVEFRTKATAKNYASEAQTATVPVRTEAPNVAIDYSAETLGTTEQMEYRVGDSGDWSPCTANMKVADNDWFGKTVQIRTKATSTAFASAVQELNVSARPTAPALKLDNATEAVIVPQDHYYSTTNAQYDNGSWTQGTGAAVNVGEKQTLYIYKAATANAFKSQVQTLTAPAKGAVPQVAPNYEQETLSTTDAMAYRVGDGGAWENCTAEMKATAFGWDGKADVVVQFCTKATGDQYASEVQTVTIEKRPAAPEGVTPTHVSVVGRKDGALTHVTAEMEYKLDSDTQWTPCNGTEVRDLAAGTYQVRKKATGNAFASETASVTVNKGAQLEVTAVDLGNIAYGYTPKAQAITITNSGDGDANIEGVAVSRDSNFEVTGSDTAVTAGGTLTTYTIQPKAGLNAAVEKPYTDTITVTYNNGATATAEVKVTVIKADPVVQAPTANDLTYNGSEQALVTAGTTNGGTLEYRLGAEGAYSTTVPTATNAGEYTVYYRVVGNDNFNPVAEQPVGVTIRKAPQVVPAAPEAEKTMLSSITLKTVADANGVKAEYGIKDKEGNYQWQATPVFEKLSSGTSYTFKVRYAENADYLGAESAEAVIRTSSRPTYPPIIPEVEGGTVIVTPNRPTAGQIVIITPQPEPGMEVDKVEVTDKNGSQIEATQKPNGDFTFKQPSGKVTITVTFKPVVPSDLPFIDVPKGAWYEDAVRYVYENGLIMGVAPNLFAPDRTTDRGQMVTILWRLAGAPDASSDTAFSDVASDVYYAKAVAWGAENGIIAGFADGSFRPNDGVSREQMAAFFMKFAAYSGIDITARADISGYTDVAADSWSYEALSWAKATGLLSGTDATTMAPHHTATRAQIAAVLERYCETIAK